MADFHLTRLCAAPPATVWDVVTDFAAYGDWMPLTRMVVDRGSPRLGWGIAGVSGLALSRRICCSQIRENPAGCASICG